jgi:NADH-quinone oxidoreductase subunit G
VAFLNPRLFEYFFPVAAYGLSDSDLVGELAAVVHAAAAAACTPLPAGVRAATVNDGHRSIAAVLAAGTRRAVILGNLAQRHPAYSELKALAGILAQLSGASVGRCTEGPNSAGAYLAGAVPHREPGGAASASPGLSARAMLESPLKAYMLFGGIDPANDLGVSGDALGAAELVVAATTHLTPSLREVAHVVLPIGSFAESAGTFVNVEGRWQSWAGAAKLVGGSRPGWKVLRVLANLLAIHGVDYISSEEIREALEETCGEGLTLPVGGAAGARGGSNAGGVVNGPAPSGRWVDIPPYQIDVLVRGSDALGKTKDGHVTRDVI